MSGENKAEIQFANMYMCDAPPQFGVKFPKLPLPRICCEQDDLIKVKDNEPVVLPFLLILLDIFDHSDRPDPQMNINQSDLFT